MRAGKIGGALAVAALCTTLAAPACGQAGPPGSGRALALGKEAEGPAAPRRTTTPCRVLRLIDGDTLECQGVGRVRLIGMDAPERAQEPYGAQATDALSRLAPAGSQVRLEPDVRATDRYGRTLAYVWTDSLMVNWALVRAGWALQATYPPNVQWVDELGRAQERAREEGAGLWGVEGFACPPDAYRARRCG